MSAWVHRRGLARASGDCGQVAAGLIASAVLALMAVLVWVIVPTSLATDQRSRAQNAADAAALAGAQGVVEDLEDKLTSPLPALVSLDEPSSLDRAFYGVFTSTSLFGRSSADRLAASNGAQVTSYSYDWSQDRVEVRVRINDRLEGGEQSQASAAAEVGMRFGRCHFVDLPTPTPTPTPSPSPSRSVASPEPSPTFEPVDLDLDCDGHDLRFRLDGGGRLRITPPGQLKSWNQLDARLIP